MCARICFIAHITRVIHNRCIFMPHKKRVAQTFSLVLLFRVGVSGLEPEKAGPESAVLPLHHTPMLFNTSTLPGQETAK